MTEARQGKWIYFELFERKPKTEVWQVRATASKVLLGIISWHGPWRSYAFTPEASTVYEDDCLIEIANFIKELMEERK